MELLIWMPPDRIWPLLAAQCDTGRYSGAATVIKPSLGPECLVGHRAVPVPLGWMQSAQLLLGEFSWRNQSSFPVRILAGKDHGVWKCSPVLNHQIKGAKPNRNTPEIVFAAIN